MPKRNLNVRRISRMILPPILTVGASAFILIEANWLHNRHTAPKTSTTAGATSHQHTGGGVTSPSLSGMKKHAADQATQTSKRSKHTQTNVSQHTTSHPASTKPSTNKQPAAPTGNIGFSPVSGGTVKAAPNPQKLELKTPLASTVTTFGPTPQTNFDASMLQAQFNINVTPKLPKGIQTSQIVLLPLSEGVLWGVVPTQASYDAPADNPAPLYYTPYGGSNPSNVTLSESSADSLGNIPITSSSSTMNTAWYKPQFSANTTSGGAANVTNGGAAIMSPNLSAGGTSGGTGTNSSGSNNTTNSDTGSGNTTGTNVTQTSDTVANQPLFRTISDVTGGTNLYLQSLYQVDGGAAIVLRTYQSGANGEWVFVWNEANKTLTPVCSVQNTSSDFGWAAIGQHTIYWSERSLIAPANVYYKGSTHMMTVATGTTRSIRLGNWSAEGVAGQDIKTYQSDPDQADDELYFRVNNTQVWKEFLPGK